MLLDANSLPQSCKQLFSYGNANNVHHLAIMGSDLSVEGANRLNVFDMDDYSNQASVEKKAAVQKVLAEHIVTSNFIPCPRFQSPLYFESNYYRYDTNLRQQRWIERRGFMMCLDSVFKWSLANQIESER
jgi:hypothetical protein